jgi:hypothetical protein
MSELLRARLVPDVSNSRYYVLGSRLSQWPSDFVEEDKQFTV